MDAVIRKQLKIRACKARMGIIEGVFNAKSGHPGGSLSCVDILTYLYFDHMNIDPQDPKNEDRDRFVLSKGHAAPALYSVLALRGFFPVEELKTLRKSDSMLQGHPSVKYTPGVDMCTGPLGQGISAACGMALGAKLAGKDFRVFTVLGDGGMLCQRYLTEHGVKCSLAPAALLYQNAVGVGLAAERAYARGETVSAQELLPVYLRPAQAERLRNAKLKQ